LNDATSVNPTLTAPETTTQINLTFQLTVTNDKGITSEPDEVTVTVKPLLILPSTEEPRTIKNIIQNIFQNPLNVTKSIKSSHKIVDILTDNNRDNDRLACDLLGDMENKQMNQMKEIIGC
jgi:hypothetical protein